MGVVAQGRGVIYKFFADVEDAEKCFHVLAMSSEALPTVTPGHRGTFQRLTRQRRGWGGNGEGA